MLWSKEYLLNVLCLRPENISWTCFEDIIRFLNNVQDGSLNGDFLLLKWLTMADCVWELRNKIIHGIKLVDDCNLQMIILSKGTAYFSNYKKLASGNIGSFFDLCSKNAGENIITINGGFYRDCIPMIWAVVLWSIDAIPMVALAGSKQGVNAKATELVALLQALQQLNQSKFAGQPRIVFWTGVHNLIKIEN